jgi:hypothetical protein
VFLLSVAGVYHVTGTLEMDAIGARMDGVDPNAAVLLAVGFFVAVSVKLGLFPFHFWLPTVYTEARPAVAATLSGGLANIGAYGILRFGGELLPRELELAASALIVIGCASIVYGGILAVSRRSAGEMLAYSAIGQVGYVLVAIGVGGPVGFAAAILYSVVNAFNKTLLFLASRIRGALVGAAFAIGAQRGGGPTGGGLRREARAVPGRERQLVATRPVRSRKRPVVRLRLSALPVRLLAGRAQRAAEPVAPPGCRGRACAARPRRRRVARAPARAQSGRRGGPDR